MGTDLRQTLGWLGVIMVVVGWAAGLPQFVSAEMPHSLVKLGVVQQQFQTDALCTLVHQHQVIWVDAYAQQAIWMNLDGKDVQLLPQSSENSNTSLFKEGDRLIRIEWGAMETVPPPGKMGMDGTIYKHAKLTISKGSQSVTLPVTGGCDGGGANWGR